MNKRYIAREISRERDEREYREPDRIIGTSKFRTYSGGDFLYSNESSLDKILRRQRHRECQDSSKNKSK